ncbi:TonB-dependent siderophore receptor [Methylobacterium sp. WCS2018Hpa-22]|uniref:TonB-dependent siderophore receptor n=1 Tax=Methylobacterium sp. WCS2018Hpa-22 TaxID=3073633 RepID=UPI002889E2D4|nr:TonB-dependent siderophore receptor [Methylobacterium sp. WCS2018Hpa-22]
MFRIPRGELFAALFLTVLATTSAFAQPAGNGITLPELTVEAGGSSTGPGIRQTTAGPVQGYRAVTSVSATKTGTPIQETPQSVQVITRELIQDQQNLTVSETLQNVSGVTGPNALAFNQFYTLVRGFPAETYIDGLSTFFQPGARDLLNNVERIEVLKGPTGILYAGGSAPIGGIVNVVSKLPVFATFTEIGITGGSRGFVSPYFDINRPLTADGTVLFRMTGQFQRDVPSVDFVETRSLAINPTVTFTNNAGTSLTLQGFYSRRTQPDYTGLPAVGTVDTSAFSIRRSLFPSSTSVPDTSSEFYGITARFEHAFSDVWSTFTNFRFSRSLVNQPDQFVLGNAPDAPPSSFLMSNALVRGNISEVSINPNLKANFDLGPTRNVLLLSADFDRVKDREFVSNFELFGPVDFNAPVFPAYVEPTSRALTPDNAYVNAGLSLQLQTTLWERIHLLAGVRGAYVELDGLDRLTGTRSSLREVRPLPKAGAIVDVYKDGAGNVVSLFADYSEGMRVVPFLSTEAFKPETSQQIEGGLKVAFASGLSGTLAAFELARQNVATADPNNPFRQVQVGEQRSRGVELDLVWQPTPNWQILGSYAHIDATVTKDNTYAIGSRLMAVPSDSGRLWANYKFLDGTLRGVSLGAGLYAASRQAITLDNAYSTPAFMTLDAKASYTVDGWTYSLVGKNLADALYFEPYLFLDGRVRPSNRRSIYATASVRF